ncbi:MAG: YlmH/Sll1252 family protein [Clostridiales bacterium]|nr:YlmH/Sll1252 family protein [Clostridiales bacterium]
MTDKHSVLKNIQDNELKLFLAKGLDKAAMAQKRQIPCFTEFAEPVRVEMLKELLKKEQGLEVRIWGGYEDAERLMAGFYPEYGEDEPFPICAVKIEYNAKYSKGLSHRDFLGSVLGLGIERGKTGDIIPSEGFALVICCTDVADFISANLEKVGRTSVRCKTVSDYESLIAAPEVKEIVKTLVSLRLDAVLSGAFNISRSAANEAVKSGRVFVNRLPVENPSKKTDCGDIITLRGKGRIKLLEVLGSTKKDKLIVKFQSYV